MSNKGRVIFTRLKEDANVISLDRYRKKGKRVIYRRRKLFDSAVGDDFVKGHVFRVEPPILPDSHITSTRDLDKIEEREIAKYLDEIKKYRKNPFRFFSKEMGINTEEWRNDKPPSRVRNYTTPPLWSKQREIIQALVDHRRVTVRSCHTSGKTYIAAGAAIYLAYVWHCLGITTAPTVRQVRLLLWQEIADMWNQANAWRWRAGRPALGGRLLQTALHLDDKWFVEGFATDSKEFNVPGFHEENTFVIVDEAGGADPSLFPLIETILSSSNSFVLYIGNPVKRDSEFRKSFDFNSGFYQISISAYDTPNVKHKKIIYPKLVHPNWPKKMADKFGKDSNFYKSRVLGDFPDEDPDSFVPYDVMEAALERKLPADEVVSLGGDIARLGGDRIVVGQRHKSGRYRERENYDKKRLTQTSGKIIVLWKELNEFNKGLPKEDVKKVEDEDIDISAIETPPNRKPVINIDDIGVGGGVTDILLEEEYPANGINVSQSPDPGDSADEKGLVKYKNKRVKFYWKLRCAFVDGEVDIDDEDLAKQLMAIKFSQNSKGEMIVIEKDQIKKLLGGESPDKAEAMMLAWAEDNHLDVVDMIQFA